MCGSSGRHPWCLMGLRGSGSMPLLAYERTMPIPRRHVPAGACGAGSDASVVRVVCRCLHEDT